MLVTERKLVMKEKIYTIPINEAFEPDCECAFCQLERNLEKEALEYSLGAAMMEPDFRVLSNKKGFCNNHYSMLFKMPNKLSLALILDTHLNEITNEFNGFNSEFENNSKKLFKKKTNKISEWFLKRTSSCVICDKINDTMKRYTEVFFYMWNKDESFRNKVLSSKGFCLNHFYMLYNNAYNNLSQKNAQEFLNLIYKKEKDELSSLKEDIHKFTLKFDYRNKDMDWGNAIDAPIRTIEKLSGYIYTDE